MNDTYILIACIIIACSFIMISIGCLVFFVYRNNKKFIDKLKSENELYVNYLQQKNEVNITDSLNDAQHKLMLSSNMLMESSTKHLKEIINPLNENIKDFRISSEKVNRDQYKEMGKLHEQLNHVLQTHNKLAEETNNLTNALKGKVKIQGNLGESILKRVLECSGLQKDKHYLEQPTISTPEGKRKPDFIIKLPENRDIVIDAKLSLNSYLDYCKSSCEKDRQKVIIEMENAFKNHVKNLTPKEYSSLEGVKAPDAVLIFIPIESIYLILADRFEKLFLEAGKHNIYVVTATSLMPLLQIIDNIWKTKLRSENAQEMAKVAGTIYDKYVGMAEEINNLEKTIEKAFSEVTKQIDSFKAKYNGRGGLTYSVDRLKKLGANTNKNLPFNWQKDSQLLDSSFNNLIEGE